MKLGGMTLRVGRNIAPAMAIAMALAACNNSDAPPEPQVAPAGRLVQQTLRGPISHTTASGWRTLIQDGTVTIRPPEAQTDPGVQYASVGTREQLGTQDLRTWSDRRSILLPGGAKLTLHGQSGKVIRMSLYDGDESHEIDVLTQTLMHSQVDVSVAKSRDEAEMDGESGHLVTYPVYIRSGISNFGLYLANLYSQNAGTNGVAVKSEVAARPLGRQFASGIHAYSDPAPVSPADLESSCDASPQPRGGMTTLPDGRLQFTTRSGSWTVLINQHTIIATRNLAGGFSAKWEVWGDPHENLNGKHVKDWEGTRRTLLLDDGTKITMDAEGAQGVVHTTSIYDGAQSHQIGNVGNVLRHSCVNMQTARQRDAEEADGETAALVVLRSPASVAGSLMVENVYTETRGTDGTVVRTFEFRMLGETGELDINPTQVNDYYDDLRLGHT